MIDLAFSPINTHHNMNTTSKFEHAQMMSQNLQTLLFQGSPSRNPDSSPSLTKNKSRQNSLYPVPKLSTNDNRTDMSSPTTSALAADMSQNFHIDKTPGLPTPRRSLFQFPKSNANRSFGLKRSVTTTSVLTTIPSSPMAMDMDEDSSPLPHKPLNKEGESFDMNPPSSSISNLPFASFKTSVKPKPFAMARMKSLSNASFLINSRPQLNPVQSSKPLTSTTPTSTTPVNNSTPTLTDSSPDTSINNLFAPSPVAQKINRGFKCKSALYISRGNTTTANTRDSFGNSRPSLTRNSKVRRTHSMFQHPEEFLTDELDEPKEPVEVPGDDSQSFLAQDGCSIKTFTVKEDPFRRIERETLCEILDGKYNNLYNRFLIIDCRFEYEYEGGHIDGAININSKSNLEEALLKNIENSNEKLLLIFHCEYSAHRGPRMAMHLRKCDRHLNNKNYPRLHYPDIVILQGGYSHFFEQFCNRCVPQRYVEMNDASHAQTCEREMDKFRKNMKFSRSQTYTFGATNDMGTPSANSNVGFMFSDFKFPLREQDTNTTPTGPSSRKLATKFSSFNDYMDGSNSHTPPQFNVRPQLKFA